MRGWWEALEGGSSSGSVEPYTSEAPKGLWVWDRPLRILSVSHITSCNEPRVLDLTTTFELRFR